MTTEFSPRENAFLKLIDIQAKEITQLGMEVDTLRYNKRYTNTKFVKAELANKSLAKTGGTFYVQADGDIKPTKGKKK